MSPFFGFNGLALLWEVIIYVALIRFIFMGMGGKYTWGNAVINIFISGFIAILGWMALWVALWRIVDKHTNLDFIGLAIVLIIHALLLYKFSAKELEDVYKRSIAVWIFVISEMIIRYMHFILL